MHLYKGYVTSMLYALVAFMMDGFPLEAMIDIGFNTISKLVCMFKLKSSPREIHIGFGFL
jgi:hypothetical protein